MFSDCGIPGWDDSNSLILLIDQANLVWPWFRNGCIFITKLARIAVLVYLYRLHWHICKQGQTESCYLFYWREKNTPDENRHGRCRVLQKWGAAPRKTNTEVTRCNEFIWSPQSLHPAAAVVNSGSHFVYLVFNLCNMLGWLFSLLPVLFHFSCLIYKHGTPCVWKKAYWTRQLWNGAR